MNPDAFSAALLSPAAAMPSDISVRQGVSASGRFCIYRNNVIVSLIDALADCYPVVKSMVGVAFFRAMAGEFARQHPPQSPIMAHYGEGFGAFIEHFPPVAALPYLADVARLEWLCVASWHAADAVPLSASDLARSSGNVAALTDACWRLHPSVARIDSQYAIGSLWFAHQYADENAVEEALADIDWSQAESALVVRQGLEVLVIRLTRDESAFVAEIEAGSPLDMAVLKAQSISPQFDLSLMFAMLLNSGALVDHYRISPSGACA